MTQPLLEVKNISVEFKTRRGALKAVDDLSIDVQPGEILGLVGESGSGKSTVALAVLGLLAPNARVTAGRLTFAGQSREMAGGDLSLLRGRDIAMIFQEPSTALNPVLTVGRQVTEVLERHGAARGAALKQRALELLEPDGYLFTCSCSYHMGREDFLNLLRMAANQAGRTAVIEEVRGQAFDHPVALTCPETDYLKCVILRVI